MAPMRLPESLELRQPRVRFVQQTGPAVEAVLRTVWQQGR
jgi:hypothetical protein